MKIAQSIAFADEMRPNQFSVDVKVQWLSELDGRVYTELVLAHDKTEAEIAAQDGGDIPFTPYDADSMDETLLIPEPYSDVYVKFLCAQIDYYLSEDARYGNDMIMFNSAWNDYVSQFSRTHMHKQSVIDVR